MTDLPIVGAAMMVEHLDRHHNWLLDRQRDLELQDFVDPALLEGDWRGRADHAREKLAGYTGRLGIYELLVMDDGLRDMVTANPDVNQLRKLCRERGLITLREDGFRKVIKGLTTVDEILRVTENA